MIELLQWILIIVLASAVVYLYRDIRRRTIPDWLGEMDSEDLLTRADFDQYHHRVIQISHVQRDLVQAKIDELTRSISQPTTPSMTPTPAPKGGTEVGPIEMKSEAPFVNGRDHLEREKPMPLFAETVTSVSAPAACEPAPSPAYEDFDPASRAMGLFRDGLNIDQIAQELRIGRQEAQLLIRMARHKNTLSMGV